MGSQLIPLSTVRLRARAPTPSVSPVTQLSHTVGLAASQNKPINAYEIVGSALDPTAQVSETVLTVQTLLAPLSNEDIKIVRCLGLNYSDHAVSKKRLNHSPNSASLTFPKCSHNLGRSQTRQASVRTLLPVSLLVPSSQCPTYSNPPSHHPVSRFSSTNPSPPSSRL